MTTFITTIGSDKLKSILAKLKKEDNLIIFHSSEEKQIPIDMISLFANAKGTVEFKESEDDIEIAFTIGKLAANPRAVLEIIGDSPVFDKINEITGSGKKTSANNSRESASKSGTGKTAAKKNTSAGNSKKENSQKDLVAFEDAYDRFTTLMESLKTDKYDPASCSLGVLSAVRLMNEDPTVTFESSLPKTTSETSARQFLKQINKTNLAKVIAAAKEVVKYDP